MPTVADLRAAGDQFSVTSYPILEPLNAPLKFSQRLSRFGSNYNLSNQSHLYRFLVTLCGDTGAGQLKKDMLIPRLEQQLESTQFGDLDRLYGNPLALPRLSTEIYSYNPDTDYLNTTQWTEVLAKDAAYRARCLTWMRAIIEGPTLRGMALATEAAIGIEADVWEEYQYIQNPSYTTDFSKTGSVNEFVVIPRTLTLAPQDTRRISRLLDILKPVNTIGTIFSSTPPRTERIPTSRASSSDYFNIQRLVTGRPDISWPTIDLSAGYWIDLTEREAPTLAFMGRQESVTYLSITDVTASSTHIGYFNADQRQLFSHLSNVNDPYLAFIPQFSYDASIAPVNLSSSWVNNDDVGSNIVVNNNYPLSYFSNVDSSFATQQQPSALFWSSIEKFPTQLVTGIIHWDQFDYGDGTHWGDQTTESDADWLMFDFGRTRPINYIHFEICQKPINWQIQYQDGGVWKDIPLNDDYPTSMSSTYLPSDQNPWLDFDVYFDLVQTQYIRILFTRRTDPFPLPTSDPIAFSIDVRGVRLMHTMPFASDFVADSGVDILGNIFRTGIITYDADNTADSTNNYWQSQADPSRFAVEALYFDMRQGTVQGTMSYLDTQFTDELDTRSMSDVEVYLSNGQLIDEVYIDPITFGPDMRFYYSDDDTPDWDEKLWVPIRRQYILKRGFHALPQPTFVRYFKIEFSNLTSIPYEPVQYPEMPPVEFRRYPLWVNNFFANLKTDTTQDTIVQTDMVTIDPLKFGFVKIDDTMVSNYEAVRTLQLTSTDPEVATFIQNLITDTTVTTQSDTESEINFRSPIMWQSDLIANLDSTRALTRVAQQPRDDLFDTGWNAELTLPITPIPVQASSNDLSQPLKEKTMPTMFFPRKCRHEYQIVRAPIDRKIAYVVGVKQVSFYRRDYTAPVDEPIYNETLDDTAHILQNDFIQNDWRYVVG